MSRERLANTSLAIFACLGVLLDAQPALACSVCYGDPNSLMAQGARAGVVVLGGVVGVVLLGMASVFIFWMRRAAQLDNPSGVEDLSGVTTVAHGGR